MNTQRLASSCHMASTLSKPLTRGARFPISSNRAANWASSSASSRAFYSSTKRYAVIHPRPQPIRAPPPSFQTSGEKAKYVRNIKIYTALILATGAAMVITVKSDLFPVPPPSNKPSSDGSIKFDAPALEIPSTPTLDVETGTSTIPIFPRYIALPDKEIGAPGDSPDSAPLEQFQLLGLGIRTVSFLGIQVYVMGMYVAIADVEKLQQRLIRIVNPSATTLVPAERSQLYELLLDPERGEEIWSSLIKEGDIRLAIRVVPTRNTDFSHLRDAWVRGITNKIQVATSKGSDEFSDETIGESIRDFKTIFGGGRGKIPKGDPFIIIRNQKGQLQAYLEETKFLKRKPTDPDDAPKKTKIERTLLGGVKDERISRLVWLLYLGGKTVSSEGARQSIVEGALELLERPIGTVATQVI